MSDHVYPIPCISKLCSKSLYGPVKYCPYCGVMIEVYPTQVLKDTTPASPHTPLSSKAVLTPPITETAVPFDSSKTRKAAESIASEHKEKFEPLLEEKTAISNPNPISGKWKWIGFAIVLAVCLVFYFMTAGKQGRGRITTEEDKNGLTIRGVGTSETSQREAARSLAIEALRQGTDVSVMISKLPKLEKVLQAAKKLQEITPRYQEQVTAAENILQTSQVKKDKSFMAYFDRVLQLEKYGMEQIEYAISSIKNGDPSPREAAVLDLLSKHLRLLHDNSKADPVRLLSDFDNIFMTFID